MLFISKIYKDNSVEITDTDDWVTEFVSYKDLMGYIKMGLKISGVSVDRSGNITGIKQVRVKVPKDIFKLNFIHGIDLETSNGVIKKMDFHDLKSNITVRLSDYGKCIDDGAIRFSFNLDSPNKIIFVLDDKIDFNVSAFSEDSRVILKNFALFDLRDLKNDKTAEKIYSSLLMFKSDIIIDNHKRNIKNIALFLGII